MTHKIVLIGRTSSGKSTLIKLLKDNKCRLPVIGETARIILTKDKDQTVQYKQIKMMYNQWLQEEVEQNFISDRGLQDYVVFSRLNGVNSNFYNTQLPHRYNLIFKLPNRPFVKDGIRVEEDEKEADRIQCLIDDLYYQTGHKIINVPDIEIQKKYEFIMDFIGHGI